MYSIQVYNVSVIILILLQVAQVESKLSSTGSMLPVDSLEECPQVLCLSFLQEKKLSTSPSECKFLIIYFNDLGTVDARKLTSEVRNNTSLLP